MVKKVLQFVGREIKGLHEAAYLLGLFAFLSQLLGLVRDRLLAAQFGPSLELDIYYASFRIPDLLFVIISSLVSLSVLVPFIVKVIKDNEAERQKFIDTIFTIVFLISIFLSAAAFILAKPLLLMLFPDLMHGSHANELTLLTRITLLQPIFLSFSSFYASFVQVYKRFFIYAISPLLYNLGIISGIAIFYKFFGLSGLAVGVVLGSLMHLIVQVPYVSKYGINPKLTFYPDLLLVKQVLKLSLPRTFALLGNQIIQIILLVFAGSMVVGSISIFSLSFNLQSVPLAIIGMSYSLAAFPTLARFFADGDMESFILQITKAARHILFWSIPITVMFIVLRAQIVRTILGTDQFSWNDTRLTAAALAIFSISIVAQSLALLFVRGFYSAGETKKPVYFAFISVLVTIISSFLFIYLFKNNTAFSNFLESLLKVEGLNGTVVLMLPLAFSIGQIVNAVLLWSHFDRAYKFFSNILWRSVFHSVGSSLIAGFCTFIFLRLLDNVFDLETLLGIFAQGFLAGVGGLIIGALVLLLLGNQEIRTVWKTLHHKILKTRFIGGE
ncbi:hypothetical protein H6775_03325 [Candidatus Nomurabacteria bacterium]|nr:hypothetical protein [Candidatus Nomurabacteria bacterium]